MTHVYLNETVIKEALKARTITEREAKELIRSLKQHKRDRESKRATVAS